MNRKKKSPSRIKNLTSHSKCMVKPHSDIIRIINHSANLIVLYENNNDAISPIMKMEIENPKKVQLLQKRLDDKLPSLSWLKCRKRKRKDRAHTTPEEGFFMITSGTEEIPITSSLDSEAEDIDEVDESNQKKASSISLNNSVGQDNGNVEMTVKVNDTQLPNEKEKHIENNDKGNTETINLLEEKTSINTYKNKLIEEEVKEIELVKEEEEDKEEEEEVDKEEEEVRCNDMFNYNVIVKTGDRVNGCLNETVYIKLNGIDNIELTQSLKQKNNNSEPNIFLPNHKDIFTIRSIIPSDQIDKIIVGLVDPSPDSSWDLESVLIQDLLQNKELLFMCRRIIGLNSPDKRSEVTLNYIEPFTQSVLLGTTINEAIQAHDIERVKTLIENYNTLLKFTDETGKRPIHFAVCEIDGSKISYEIVKYLIQKGEDLDTLSEQGYNALHYAINMGNIKAVRYLVENAKVNSKIADKTGKLPIELATINDHTEIVKYLSKENKSEENKSEENNKNNMDNSQSQDITTMDNITESGISSVRSTGDDSSNRQTTDTEESRTESIVKMVTNSIDNEAKDIDVDKAKQNKASLGSSNSLIGQDNSNVEMTVKVNNTQLPNEKEKHIENNDKGNTETINLLEEETAINTDKNKEDYPILTQKSPTENIVKPATKSSENKAENYDEVEESTSNGSVGSQSSDTTVRLEFSAYQQNNQNKTNITPILQQEPTAIEVNKENETPKPRLTSSLTVSSTGSGSTTSGEQTDEAAPFLNNVQNDQKVLETTNATVEELPDTSLKDQQPPEETLLPRVPSSLSDSSTDSESTAKDERRDEVAPLPNNIQNDQKIVETTNATVENLPDTIISDQIPPEVPEKETKENISNSAESSDEDEDETSEQATISSSTTSVNSDFKSNNNDNDNNNGIDSNVESDRKNSSVSFSESKNQQANSSDSVQVDETNKTPKKPSLKLTRRESTNLMRLLLYNTVLQK